ncbi:hypothetical protein D3C85_1548380 [compost metagenome]
MFKRQLRLPYSRLYGLGLFWLYSFGWLGLYSIYRRVCARAGWLHIRNNDQNIGCNGMPFISGRNLCNAFAHTRKDAVLINRNHFRILGSVDGLRRDIRDFASLISELS